MATFTLPLDPIANIMVNLSARSAVRKAFNLALLMGDVPDDVEFGSVRIKTYANTTEMLQDGFTTDDRLYKAAELVFGQDKKPPLVAVGKALKTSGTLEQPVATLQACREEDGEVVSGYLLRRLDRRAAYCLRSVCRICSSRHLVCLYDE